MVGDRRQGTALLAVMVIIFVVFLSAAVLAEQQGNPRLAALGVDQSSTADQSGGNMEGKEVRFGIANSALWATATTAASNGSVNAMHDAFTPLGGLVPMLLMQLGEVIFGGVGSGLYGLLAFAIVAVFVAGLMVGRTPEYLGKKIEAFEMKMATLVILIPPLVVLLGTAVAVITTAGQSGATNPGPHGFSQILYAFSSQGNNNGSAFAGINGSHPFYPISGAVAMLIARYWLIVPSPGFEPGARSITIRFMSDKRPDPDLLLTHIQQNEAQEKRGRLKIFLGYAAGVGKSYAMLEAAQQRRAEGEDVVVGYVETHGRAETEAFLEGLELIPRREITYRGVTLTEMDTDAILQRRPQIVLVDELAHTNVPSSRHVHRYQDVLELLSSGIDVYTTMNIQHLESLNDVVSQVTGVTMRETVPDHILDGAYEIELIDLPIDELLARLEAGKVYIPAQAERALRKFFRPGNLTALREMALRRAAERVDEQMRSYMQTHAIPGPWPAGERLLVCVSPSPLSERLVRTTRRLARRLDAEWIAAYVETPGQIHLLEADEEQLARTLRLAEELGAQTVRLNGQSVAETLVNYALSRNVTKIVAGKPLHSRWREWWQGSLIDQILRQSQDMDVYVISGKVEPASPAQAQPSGSRQPVRWQPYLLGSGLVLLVTLMGLPLRPFINPTNLVMLYLAVVMVAAVWLGRRPAIIASLLSILAFDIIFVPPYYTLVVSDAEYLLTFVGLLAVSLVISTLAARAQEQALAARRRQSQTAALYELSQGLATVSDPAEIARTSVGHVQSAFNSPAALFLPETAGERLAIQAATPDFHPEPEGHAVADWVFRHGQPAGRLTDTLTGVNGYYLPLQTSGQVLGILAVVFPEDYKGLMTGEQRRFLASFSSQVALALERAYLAEQARHARLLEETEKLQTTLLNAISHDLRTPLASITGALSSLVEDADLLSDEARNDLAQTAWDEALRLNRLVGNLLDMTRLESGAMKVVRRPNDVQDFVGATLAQMPIRLKDRIVNRIIPDTLPPVSIDFALMMPALINLVDNAVKYTPSSEPIDIEAYQEGQTVVIAVKDRGPGLPEGSLEQIFNKFYRVNAGIGSGIGLGLSIAKGIVEAHNGRIWAQNRPGGGAIFSMALPVAEEGVE